MIKVIKKINRRESKNLLIRNLGKIEKVLRAKET